MKSEEYRKEILDMLKSISDVKILKLLYGFTRSAYREEQAVIRINKMFENTLNN